MKYFQYMQNGAAINLSLKLDSKISQIINNN